MKLPYSFRVPEEAADDAKAILAGEYDLAFDPPPRTVLDIGANVGLFSFFALQRWPGCQITAYEPDPDNFADLETNLGSEINALLAGVSSRLELNADFRKGENCMRGRLDLGHFGSTVAEAAGDIPSHELVKIDVEGHEMHILPHLDLLLTRGLMVETHSDELHQQCTAVIEARGFVIVSDRPTVNGCRMLKALRPSEIPADPEIPDDAKIFVAIPTYGGMPAHFVQSLLKLQSSPPCPLALRFNVGDSLVSRSRNNLAAEFLESTDCTHMLFIDSDLIFSPDHIARLVASGKDIIGGLYPKKQKELAWVCNLLDDTWPDGRGLQRVKYIGTGFLMIKREVLLHMIEHLPEIAYDPDDGCEGHRTRWDLFPVGPHSSQVNDRRRYLSEDWFFCDRALSMGYDVWADTRVVLKHIGQMIYPLAYPPV